MEGLRGGLPAWPAQEKSIGVFFVCECDYLCGFMCAQQETLYLQLCIFWLCLF